MHHVAIQIETSSSINNSSVVQNAAIVMLQLVVDPPDTDVHIKILMCHHHDCVWWFSSWREHSPPRSPACGYLSLLQQHLRRTLKLAKELVMVYVQELTRHP